MRPRMPSTADSRAPAAGCARSGYIDRYVTPLDPKKLGRSVSVLVQVTLEKQIEPAFERFILEFLSKVPGVGNIKSSFALKQVKYQTALPLPVESAARKQRKR